jgi:TonB family protein
MTAQQTGGFLLATAMLAASPATAQAPTPMTPATKTPRLFEQFSAICLATDADSLGVALTAKDWKIVPNFPVSATAMFGGPFESYAVRSWTSPEHEDRTLVVGVKASAGASMNTCAVSGDVAAGALEDIRKWAGPAHASWSSETSALYVFSGRSLPADAAGRKRVQAGETLTITFSTAPGGYTVMSYGSSGGSARPGAKQLITKPDWIEAPSAALVAEVYPEIAQRTEQGGDVVLQCAVEASGHVTDCSTIYESPAGLKFGEAALSLAPVFKMRPAAINGKAVSGALVRIPIRFRIAIDQPARQAAPSVGKN